MPRGATIQIPDTTPWNRPRQGRSRRINTRSGEGAAVTSTRAVNSSTKDPKGENLSPSINPKNRPLHQPPSLHPRSHTGEPSYL
ncbi:hypothetical protein F2Q70_00005915 [Brassica cretica]|uniref:Uncharacterized protein n=1 Tax=Brassica cretica TaxID=69181 RepID=A0A8S9ISS4_BRACR|nr:hypothetical protein F2Q70_00005915 [Brassica cretica]